MPRPLALPLFFSACGSALALSACGGSIAAGPTTVEPGTAPLSRAPESIADPAFIEAYTLTYRFGLGHPSAFHFTRDGSQLLFLRGGARSFVNDLYALDLASGEERVLLTAAQILDGAEEELSAEERARRERTRSVARGIASFDVSPDGASILVPLSGRLFLVDRERAGQPGSVRELASSAGFPTDPRFSPDGTAIAVVRQDDLYVIDVASGRERRLTERARDTLSYGTAEFVAQEEMSRMEGYWWSPDGRSVLVQETDVAGVEAMHILDPMHPDHAPESPPYPRPGHPNAIVRLGFVPARGGAMRFVEWDRDAYPYLATVRWPASGPVILVQDRLQEHEVLLRVDPATGRTTELLREEDAAWLNLDQDLPRFLADGTFLWTSERSGSWQLELRAADGALVRTLTPPELGLTGLLAVDEARGVAFVSASDEPTEAHLFRVPLDGSGPSRLDEGGGIHEAVFSGDASRYVEVHRTLGAARAITVRDASGAVIARPASHAEAPGFTPNVTLETVGERGFRAAIVRPRNFDPSLRYPVLLYVYAGPGVRQVLADRDKWLLPQWFADHGFVVVSADGRGTPGRGRAWERAIDGDFAGVPLEDQVAALQALGAAHPELDLDRVGVYGWSFGGYFSAMATIRRPDVFRAGIAGAPVSEWRDYDTHYTERYVGLPEEDGSEGPYRLSSVLTYASAAEGVRRPLLVVHGTADDNVYFSHALKLCDALFRAGRPFELLPLAGFTHMVPEPAVAARLNERQAAFFLEHLAAR
jgi:dipeptidyl-peptidase-4